MNIAKWIRIGAVWGALMLVAGFAGNTISNFAGLGNMGLIGTAASFVLTGGIAAWLYKKIFRKYEE